MAEVTKINFKGTVLDIRDAGAARASDLAAKANSADVVPNTRTVNGKALSSNITLSASDIGAIPTVISTTYNDLVTVRTNSQLIEGAWYRITDYTCTTSQTDTKSAEHQFDILVQAISLNRLSDEAKAIRHEGDTYFAHSNLEAWKIWYCLDNDTTRFAWADETNGKGVIYRMIDEHNNDCPYDFKNIQFKRYKITATTKTDTSLVGKYRAATTTMKEHTVDANDFVWCYTFNGYYASWYQEDEESGYLDYENLGSVAIDMSNFDLLPFYDDNYFFSQRCGDNRIQPSFDNIHQWLNNIVIYGWVADISTFPNNFKELYGDYIDEGVMSSCYSNTFGDGCNSNTFGNNCNSNTFGDGCYSNTFGDNYNYNTFGDSCHSNTFGDNCNSNTFGNNCNSNTFGSGCHSNTFGNNCNSNTFGSGCHSNTFGNNCNSNTFGDGCYYNTFGDNYNSNTFGNSCHSNTFGNNCNSNTFGNNCNSNTFGSGCDYNTFGKPYAQYVIVENGNQRITLTSTQTPTNSRPLRNITIAQGVNNTNTTKIINHNTLNDTFRTTYTVDDSGNIYAITPTKYGEWDNKQSALVSGTNIKTINNQSLLGSGNLTASDIGALPSNTHIPADQVQSNWNETNTSSKAYIQNKPTIPAAQVNSDWDASSGVAQILNKPTFKTINGESIVGTGDIEAGSGDVATAFTITITSTTIEVQPMTGAMMTVGTDVSFQVV